MAVQRLVVLLAAAGLACLAVLALVEHDAVRPRALFGMMPRRSLRFGPAQRQFAILSAPASRNWRLNDEALPCADDPECGYGGIATDREAAYADPSPLAIIGEQYGEGDVNPYPGPKNWGPDSPISWLPEEEMEGYEGMVREQWPEYPAPISE
ncbi:hypothetical protein T484DRAFT_1900334 [Baffinella frigidus]|nr:hypothetical protein T484DRAFT_1900334 [Cryptophyta sp. CCMP2293]